MKKKIQADSVIKFFVSIIGIFIIAFILSELAHIFIPFVFAYFLFFLFSPLNFYFEKIKFPTVFIILIDVAIVVIIFLSIGGFLLDSFLRFSSDLQNYFDKINLIVRELAVDLKIRDPYFRSFSIQKIISKLDYKELAGGVFSSAFSITGSIFFVLLFFVFIVGGHHGFIEAIRKRYVQGKIESDFDESLEGNELNTTIDENHTLTVKHSTEIKLDNTFKAITKQIQNYIISKIIINLATGIITAFALFLLDVDFPIIWGLLTFFLNFIPTIGSAVALILPTLMGIIQHDSLGYGVLIAAIMALIQTLAFNITEPILLGRRLDLNPIMILLSVLIWGYIWGIAGMLLAVPLTAIIKIIISNSESPNLKFISDLMDSD
ncbi:MAG: AI-2E family transporter [Ignavibacteria bacterium]|nr:AI-2E family transporter [Ignavibacteria bacterium]